MHIKERMKRAVALGTCISLIMTSNAVYAGIGGAVGGTSLHNPVYISGNSTPAATSSIVKTYPWKTYSGIDKTGYRMYVIDNQENLVSSVFDLRLRRPSKDGTLGNIYKSTYKEKLVQWVSGDTSNNVHVAENGDELPLGVLKSNPMYGRTQTEAGTGKQYIDTSMYLSTAMSPDDGVDSGNGIKAFVLDSLTNSANAIASRLQSAVVNGNSDTNKNGGSGKNTTGTTSKSGNDVVINTGDTAKDSLITRINKALNSGDSSRYSTLLQEALSTYGERVFDSPALYSVCKQMAMALSPSSSMRNAVRNNYPSGLSSIANKKKAYANFGGGVDAFIGVVQAKATSTGKIGGLTIAKEEKVNEKLEQIIATSGETDEVESTDTQAIDNMLKQYMTFKDPTMQAYVNNGVYWPTEIMSLNNYTLVVEPIMWFRWANGEYQEASVGFTCTTSYDVTTEHKDEKKGWWKNDNPVEANTEGATEYNQDAVKEVVKITYTWKYKDDNGTEQSLTTSHSVTEGTDYTYEAGKKNYEGCASPKDHYPSFTYDGNATTFSTSAGIASDAKGRTGGYNGYDKYYAYATNSRYKEDPKWTYGSLRDGVNYCVNKSGINGQLEQLLRIYLPAAMTVTKDMAFDGRTTPFKGATGFTFNGTDLSTLSSKSADWGYGMHMYQASAYYTKTRDDGDTIEGINGILTGGYTPGVIHKAPRPEDPSKYTEKSGELTIVKTYRTWSGNQIGEGEIIESKTMVRYQEPPTVYILNEETWKLTEWYTSDKSSLLKDGNDADNTAVGWEDMKNQVYGVHYNDPERYKSEHGNLGKSSTGFPEDDGWQNNNDIPFKDGNCKVSLSNLDETPHNNTLYVLFEKCKGTPDGIGAGADLTQSELYDVKTLNQKIDKEYYPGLPDTLPIDGNTFSESNNDIKYMLVRGQDKVTFRKFIGNMTSFNRDEETNTSNLVDNWYIGPNGDGASTEAYPVTYDFLKEDDSTDAKDTETNEVDVSARKITVDALIDVYHGKVDVTSDAGDNGAMQEVNEDKYNARVKSATLSDIVPYYWMTISDLSGKKSIRYMSGENTHKRKMNVYDYAEVSVVNKGELKISSNMWATDKSITDGAGANALKGGAAFKISTPTKAKIKATTYCNVMDDFDDNGNTTLAKVTLVNDQEEISSAAAMERHETFVENLANDIQDDYSIRQYVTKGKSNENPATNEDNTAANSSAVWACNGKDISALQNNITTASNESKYYLREDGDVASTSLMETDVKSTSSKYIRVFSLPNGNIYYVTGNTYSDCDSNMQQVTRSIQSKYDSQTLTGYDGATESIVCKKGDYNNILCPKEIKAALKKSRALKSLVGNIELNTGNDNSAPWTGGSDNTWYNEAAWLTILQQDTEIEIGLVNVNERLLVLDPKLTPKQDKKSNGSATFNTSAFRADWIGGEEDGKIVVGTFRGQKITGVSKTMKSLFKPTDVFYIPNRTVTDNK